MSTMYKMIIPLLGDFLTKEDFSKESGFVDIFSEDINRPYLDNHIFLMYKFDTKESTWFRNKRFKESGMIYNQRTIFINHVCYTVYAIPIVNKEVRRIHKGLNVSNYNDKIKIVKFWNFEEGDVNALMLKQGVTFNYEHKAIPEEDYRGDDARSCTHKKVEIPSVWGPGLSCFLLTALSR